MTGQVSGATLVTVAGFTKEAKLAVEQFPFVALKTFSDLESELLDFSHRFAAEVFTYEHDEIFQTYIPLAAQTRNLSSRELVSSEEIDSTLLKRLSDPEASVSLVLADFGAGKSPVLKRIYYKMAQEVLARKEARRP